MITIDARDAHEVGPCQSCGDSRHQVMVVIAFGPPKGKPNCTVNLCYTCVQLLRGALVETNAK